MSRTCRGRYALLALWLTAIAPIATGCGQKETKAAPATSKRGPKVAAFPVEVLKVEAAPHEVVVAAPGQELPALPAGVELAFDPVEGRGPMQGVAVGLAAVASATTARTTRTSSPR